MREYGKTRKEECSDFVELVNLVGDLEIHQKVAIPMFFVSLDSPQNFDPVLVSFLFASSVLLFAFLFLYCSLGQVFGLLMMAGLSPKYFVCNLGGKVCRNPMQIISSDSD